MADAVAREQSSWPRDSAVWRALGRSYRGLLTAAEQSDQQ
jgi:hypothetical protein